MWYYISQLREKKEIQRYFLVNPPDWDWEIQSTAIAAI